MKNVLIVDDEKSCILSFRAGMESHYPDFNILTAEHGKAASEILESTHVDLVVTDLRMPEMDGFELLAYMSTNFPSIPAIVMSAYGTPDAKDRLKTMGSLRFIDKPVDFDELGQAIIDGLEEAPGGGSLNGISISGFLQLIEMEQKTCLLEIHPEDKSEKGFFYFNKGRLYDAVCADAKGQEAALEIIGWDNVMINFKSLPKKKFSRRINKELVGLIMEGMRLKDESASVEASETDHSIGPDRPELDLQLSENPETGGKGGDRKNPLEDPSGEEEIEKPEALETFESQGGTQMALKDVLQQMAGEIDGMITTSIQGMDGVLIAEVNPTGAETEQFSARFAMIMKLEQNVCRDIGPLGALEENIMQTESTFCYTRMLGDNHYLCIAISKEGTLGMVRMVAQKYADQLKAELG